MIQCPQTIHAVARPAGQNIALVGSLFSDGTITLPEAMRLCEAVVAHELNKEEDRDWITVEEAASRLRVSRQSIMRMITRGMLEVKQVGGGTVRPRYRIHQRSLLEGDQKRDTTATSPVRLGVPTRF